MKRPAYQGEIDYFVQKYGTNIDDAGLNEIKVALIPMGTNATQLEETKQKVINIYRDTLKREPTQAEIDRWVNAWGVSMEYDEYQAFIAEANVELAKTKPLTTEIATQLMIKAATTALSETEANQYGGYSEISRVFETTGQDLATLVKNLDKRTATNLAAQVAVTGVGNLSFMGQTGVQLTQTGLINMINNGIDANSLTMLVQNYTNPASAANAAAVIEQATILAQDDAIATAANNAAYLIGQVNQTGISTPIVQNTMVQLQDEMKTASVLQSQAIQQQQAAAAAAAAAATTAAAAAAATAAAAKAKALTSVKQTTTLTPTATNVNLTKSQIATNAATTGKTPTETVSTGTVTIGSTTGITGNLTPLLFIAGAAFLLGKI